MGEHIMDVVLNAFQSVLSIIILIVLGYFLARRGFLDKNAASLFSRLVINVSLPAMMVYNVLSFFDREKLYSSGNGIIIPAASMLICYFVAVATAKLIKVNPERKGIFQAMFFASNTIFMGMPVNMALFGEQSVSYVLFYYAANTTIFWTLGIYSISKDKGGSKDKVFSINTVKRIFSPPLLGLLAGLLIVMSRIQLPIFILDSCRYLGELTTPMSLLYIGISFSAVDIKKFKFDKDMAALLLGRFVISPLVVYGLTLIFPIPGLMAKVFIIQSAMPVITQSAIIAGAYGGDQYYATYMVTLTTILSVAFIPAYMVLISGI
jgi:auxin efflux carrier (AEC)